MPTYKLSYFPIPGRGESARLIFAVAGVEFEDNRVPFADWPEQKPKMTFNGMPELSIDGKTLAQTSSICRYLGREFGLMPKTSFEQAVLDGHIEYLNEVTLNFVTVAVEKDAEQKEVNKKKCIEAMPQYFTKFENLLTSTGTGYLVGGRITWGDIMFLTFLEHFISLVSAVKPELEKSFPKVNEHLKKIASHPKIVAYRASRPPLDKLPV